MKTKTCQEDRSASEAQVFVVDFSELCSKATAEHLTVGPLGLKI